MSTYPKSPKEMTGGMMYFPRMLDKIRLHERGELSEDYHANLGRPRTADGACTNFLRINYGVLRQRVFKGGTDEEILEWCYTNGRRLNEGDLLVWNGFASKLGWNDFASAQLSFPYLMALALKFRAIRFEYFNEDVRGDAELAALARKFHISAPPEIDRLYPQLRPARVTVMTEGHEFTRQADEALGSRLLPLDDADLQAKFRDLVAPVHGGNGADGLAKRLWAIDELDDVASLVEALAKQPQ